jgi:DNA modification methylase
LRDTLHHGDNLGVLRHGVADGSVDLAYLDPPFGSGQDYSAHLKVGSAAGDVGAKPAFQDTWVWGPDAEGQVGSLVADGGPVGGLMDAFRRLLGPGPRLAYLAMVAPRVVEVRRVLRRSGSAYLHCDPTASHHLRLLMDAAFGPENFRSEVVWRRSSAHNRSRRFGPVHDVLLHYARSAPHMAWSPVHEPYSELYAEETFGRADADGRRFRAVDLTASRPGFSYEWKGRRPAPGRYWATSEAGLRRLEAEGRLLYTRHGNPKLKRYLDEMAGRLVPDVWSDIPAVSPRSAERLGYPTQKPVALVERIVRASCPEGGVVLDPFCGSGTALAAAHRLGRRWIGIDSSPVAIGVARRRMAALGAEFDVVGEGGGLAAMPHSPVPAQG